MCAILLIVYLFFILYCDRPITFDRTNSVATAAAAADDDVYLFIYTVLLYGDETWSLTLREESRLRVFENKILRRIFGP